MSILVPGIITGVAGIFIGTSIKNRSQIIEDSLGPLKTAIKEFETLLNDFSTTCDELQAIYTAYQNDPSASIDWEQVTALKAELKTKELAIDNQVTVIDAIIKEVEGA